MERKNYKQIYVRDVMEKRGQVAIFVIVAVAIVIGGILLYFFFPQVKEIFIGTATPNDFLANCLSDEVNSAKELLAKQGGYENPEGFIRHRGENVKYLCYTSVYYFPCVVQQPSIKNHFESELQKMIDAKAKDCVREMIDAYEKKGYTISSTANVETSVEIIPKKIKVLIKAPMTMTKDSTITYENFEDDIESEMYNLLFIAHSIIDYEATYGNTETTMYMLYYPNLMIEKNKLGDGSTVYTVGDVTTNEEFTFAVRSLAWPPGYGLK